MLKTALLRPAVRAVQRLSMIRWAASGRSIKDRAQPQLGSSMMAMHSLRNMMGWAICCAVKPVLNLFQYAWRRG